MKTEKMPEMSTFDSRKKPSTSDNINNACSSTQETTAETKIVFSREGLQKLVGRLTLFI
jgi:hypothetical protein